MITYRSREFRAKGDVAWAHDESVLPSVLHDVNQGTPLRNGEGFQVPGSYGYVRTYMCGTGYKPEPDPHAAMRPRKEWEKAHRARVDRLERRQTHAVVILVWMIWCGHIQYTGG